MKEWLRIWRAETPADFVRKRLIHVAFHIMGASFIGAVLTFVYSAVVSPVPNSVSPAARAHIIRVNEVVFVIFMSLTGLVGQVLLGERVRRVARWAVEERAPRPDEVDRMLRLPRSMLVYPASIWLLAAVTFGVLQTVQDTGWVLVWRTVDGIIVGGFVTMALTYLLVERELRPVAALVLSYGVLDRPRAPGILPRIVVSWLLGAGLPLLAVGLTQVMRTPEERQHLQGAIWFLVVVGVATGAIAMTVAAKSVAEPISALREVQREVERGRLDVRVPVNDASEVGLLQAGFNDMVEGLEERRRLQDIFGRHVGEDVARHALERGVALGGETRDVTVLFADVIGSTALAQRLPAEDLMRALNDFFAAVVVSAREEGGWVNKFDGDGALCVFGAPADLPDHRAAALRAAKRLHERLGLDAGIGISSGSVTAGNVGAEERFEYTVIGDPVNEAARLTEVAKQHPTRVLASAGTVEGAGGECDGWTKAGAEILRGRSEPTTYYTPDLPG